MTKLTEAAEGRILVAKESFTHTFQGAVHVFVEGQSRVREGHPVLRGIEHLFEPIRPQPGYEIEDASAAPGSKRGQ